MVLEYKWAIIIVLMSLALRLLLCEWRILFFFILQELNPRSDKIQIGVAVRLLQLDALT